MTLPPDDNRMRPDHAPTPFSPEEIASACAPGRVNVFRIEEQGDAPVVLTWRFVTGDDSGGEGIAEAATPDGMALGDPVASRSAWSDLQAHASYPEEATTITQDTVVVPAGTFDCWLYTVVDGRILTRAWFAKDLAGPPVLKIDEVDGEVVATMTLHEVSRPPAGA